jgi:hypothetical protein
MASPKPIHFSDPISSLPSDKKTVPKPGDLEYLFNLFQPKNKEVIFKASSIFTTAIVGALLFAFLSLPFFDKMIQMFSKGNFLYSKVILTILYFIIFWIIDQYILKN